MISTPHECRKDVDREPLTVRISAAVKLTGLSRSRVYELIQAGDLQIVKVGRCTLIRFDSLKRLVRDDPQAG